METTVKSGAEVWAVMPMSDPCWELANSSWASPVRPHTIGWLELLVQLIVPPDVFVHVRDNDVL